MSLDDVIVVIDAKFNGPDGSANGGYTCGLLAQYLDTDTVEVTLLKPPPLDSTLRIGYKGEVVELTETEETFSSDTEPSLVAIAKPSELSLVPPSPPAWEQARQASQRYTGFKDHPFPHCFVCGPNRPKDDGLKIFAGPLDGQDDMVAAVWTPDNGLAQGGFVNPHYLWCALDCPGAFALDQGAKQPRVLGRLTARILSPLPVGKPAIVLGWSLGIQGRKAFAGTAIYDLHGKVCAVAKAVWITVAKGFWDTQS